MYLRSMSWFLTKLLQGPPIMELIISNLVKLDVDWQVELPAEDDPVPDFFDADRPEDADDLDEEQKEQVFAWRVKLQLVASQRRTSDDNDDAESDTDSELDEDDPNYDAEVVQIEKAAALGQKLDAIMDLLFRLYDRIFENPESDEARGAFQQMVSNFDKHILPTRRSRHTQFLIFHYSQKADFLMDAFLGELLLFSFQSNRQAALREAAVAYLGSFVARGANVTREIVRQVTTILCSRIRHFSELHKDRCRGPNLQKYRDLYAWFQALLYIFCFRWKDLVISPNLVDLDEPLSYRKHEIHYIRDFRETLLSLIGSRFNPLKVCAPAIVRCTTNRFLDVFAHMFAGRPVRRSRTRT